VNDSTATIVGKEKIGNEIRLSQAIVASKLVGFGNYIRTQLRFGFYRSPVILPNPARTIGLYHDTEIAHQDFEMS